MSKSSAGQPGSQMRLDQHYLMVAGPHPRSRRARRRGFAALPSGASRWLKALCLLPFALSLVGCRQDMHDQPKYRGLRASAFFADGSSARPLVEGTVARGTLQEDEAFFTGKVNKIDVKELPFAVDEQVLNRGQERFDIYCAPCHDRTGGGNGMVVQRGYRQPPSFHIDRLRQADAGHFFDVMTNGFGAMPDYKVQIAPRDRWNIVAYIRALQLSQHAAAADVPGGDPTKVPRPTGGEQAPEKH
jgi:mono/diheme cytochrome c family protein